MTARSVRPAPAGEHRVVYACALLRSHADVEGERDDVRLPVPRGVELVDGVARAVDRGDRRDVEGVGAGEVDGALHREARDAEAVQASLGGLAQVCRGELAG